MSQYNSLRATINDNVKTNNNEEITGAVLNAVLNEMVTILGAGYQFMGVATPTDPASAQTPDYKCFYLATTPGTYSNLGGLVVRPEEVALLKYDASWSKVALNLQNRSEFRPYAAMGASAIGSHFIDINHVFSADSMTYVPSGSFDSVWVSIMEGATKISVTGATPYRFRYFSSSTTPDGDTAIGSNTTGEIPTGSKLCLISFRQADNPGGYDQLSVKQDGVASMINRYFPKGLYLATNHVLNVASGLATIKYQANANFDCFIIYTQGATKIKVSNLIENANYYFFDSDQIFDGSDIVSHLTARNTSGNVPEGSVLCVISMRKTDYPDGHELSTLSRSYGEDMKKIRVLLIGNSASDDAFSYVPFIMQNMGIPVNFQVGIAMMSSSTLANHVSNWENGTPAYGFRLYDGGASWRNYSDKTLQWIFDNYSWDVVSLQQASPQRSETYQPYLNKLINYISGYVENGIKFIWHMTQIYAAQSNGGAPRGDETMESYYESEVGACQNIVGGSICERIVPTSTAIQNARTIPAIKALGDYANNENNTTGIGYLCALDGVHLQEGLPCQIAAYAFVLTLLDMYGFEEFSINGETTRATEDWTTGKNIPSPHGNPIGATDTNCLIAQKCAIMAIKYPFQVTDMNYIIDPES